MKYLIICILSLQNLLTLNAANKEQTNFDWNYEGRHYHFEMELNDQVLRYYRAMPKGYSYSYYTKEDRDHKVVGEIAEKIWKMAKAEGLDDWGSINLMMAFVQQLRYQAEGTNTVEEVKYPIETLADGGGDCEDSAILLAAMLRTLGYNTVLINPSGHMSVGVACDNCNGAFIEYDKTKYYYVETTYPGWEIGEMPDQFRTKGCGVYHVLTDMQPEIRGKNRMLVGLKGEPVSRTQLEFMTDNTPVKPTPAKVPEPVPSPKKPEPNMESTNGDLIMTSKRTMQVNGHNITAYTQGNGKVQVVQEDDRVKIYTTGTALVVVE